MFIKRLLTYSILSLIAIGGFFGNINIEIYKSTFGFNTSIFAAECTAENTSGCTNPTIQSAGKTAGTATSSATQPTDSQKLYNSIIDGLNVGLGVLTLLVSPAIMLAGWLMSPDWTSGDLFGLREPMYRLWVTVSNIVYFVYAVLLILIALGTMLNQEKFSYKVMLPKLALGILMVPFTWWFVQWTISLSSVLTASVLTIPAETIKQLNPNDVSAVGDEKSTWWTRPSVPKVINIKEQTADQKKDTEEKAKANQAAGTKDLGVSNPYDGSDCSKADQCMAPSQFLTSYGGMYSYMMVYAYSVFNFQEVKKINTATDHVGVILQLVNQSIVSMIMFMVFGLLTLALVTMLLTRAIKLWVYAIFSPLFTFRFVAGSNIMGGEEDTFTIKEFIGLAFVPAIVGLTLSFGLIMVGAVTDGNTKAPTTGPCNDETIKIKMKEDGSSSGGCELAKIMGSDDNKIIRGLRETTDKKYESIHIVKFGGTSINYYGKVIGSNDLNAEAKSVNSTRGILSSTGGIFGTIVVDIIALMFIWLAFMAAKNVSKAVKAAVQPFEDIGNKIGGLAKKIPQYTPLPIPGGSVKGLGKMTDMASTIPDAMLEKKLKDDPLYKLLKEKSGYTNDPGDKGRVMQMMQDGNLNAIRDVVKQNNAESSAALMQESVKNTADTTRFANQFIGADKSRVDELIKAIKEAKTPEAAKDAALMLSAMVSGQKSTDNSTKNKGDAKIFLDNQYNNRNNTTPPTPITVNIGGSEFSIADNIKGDGEGIAKVIEGSDWATRPNKPDKNTVEKALKTGGINEDVIKTVLDKLFPPSVQKPNIN